MNYNSEHIDLDLIDRKSKLFFSGGEFAWEKSQADIWMNLEQRIDSPRKARIVAMRFSMTQWMAAASVVILFAVGGFMKFYTVSVQSPVGNHAEVVLPDQSRVKLNAESTISYHPFWWKISRTVKLEGEAFFEVEKGRKFTVNSSKGATRVLGTSFNIFAREDIYRVTCVTGTVKVSSKNGYEAVIKPNSSAEITSGGQIKVTDHIEILPEISWKENLFLFTAKPVLDVFREIERQYGVIIDVKTGDNLPYTGNFKKDQNVEEVLAYICPAMEYKLVKKSPVEFLIIRNDE